MQRYIPISDVVTGYQQAFWSLMVNVLRTRINDPNVVNFGDVTEHSL